MSGSQGDRTQALAGMALLVRVIETGSISAAARELDLPKSTVSRRLTALEADLGVPLLRRSTRSVTLTDAGRTYFEAALPAVRAALEADALLRTSGGRIAGTVRVSVTSAYARYVLLPRLCAFMSEHPEVRLDLDVRDRRVGVVTEGIDIAIRMGPVEDAALYLRRIGLVKRRFVASRDYADAHPLPTLPQELSLHNAVVTSSSLLERRFTDGTSVVVPWRMAMGTMEIAHDACLSGFGIALLPDFLIARDLEAGRLVECLADFPEPEVVVSALFPNASRGSPAARALIDHLAG